MTSEPAVQGRATARPKWTPDDTPSLLLVACIAEREFAIPATAVERIVRMVAVTPLLGGPAHVLGVINLHGSVIPVLDPRPILGLPASGVHPDQHLIIISATHRFALWVDRIDHINAAQPTDYECVNTGAEHGSAPLVVRLNGAVIPVLSLSALNPGPLIRPTAESTR